MKPFWQSKTVWMIAITFAINGLNGFTGTVTNPTALLLINGALAALTAWARSVAAGPLTVK